MLSALSPAQWAFAALGAFFIGFSKTGIGGVGILGISLFAILFPAHISPGIVLPLLIAADVIAVVSYKKHAVWSHLLRLFPWAAVGVLLGYFAAQHINARGVAVMMGVILLFMVAAHVWRRSHPDDEAKMEQSRSIGFAIVVGLLAGFTTMIANAAGPIMVIYLLTMRLPKMEFMGTGAWYFLILNVFKVPFQYSLNNITTETLGLDLKLVPFALAGAFFGRSLLPHINEELFENTSLFLTVVAGLKLLWG